MPALTLLPGRRGFVPKVGGITGGVLQVYPELVGLMVVHLLRKFAFPLLATRRK